MKARSDIGKLKSELRELLVHLGSYNMALGLMALVVEGSRAQRYIARKAQTVGLQA